MPHRRGSEYWLWCAMRQRCSNPKTIHYHRYGGRGIVVCAAWSDFNQFLADMGPRPSSGHSIDRIDNDGNYEPGNCRWATSTEQGRNSSRVRFLTFNGETLDTATWSERTGIDGRTIRARIRLGWSTADALTQPVGKNGVRRSLTINGQTRSLTAWAGSNGVSGARLSWRLKYGWVPERAILP